MWSFKSLEIVCQKEDALNFQNFTTIENGFQKIQTFPFLTFFFLYGWFKWSCRTSKTTSRVLERESLRVTPFPFVRRAMGTANSFKTKRSKLKFWLRSGNEVAYRQYLWQTLAAGLINNTPRVVALSRNEAWRSGGSATTRGVLFISRVSIFKISLKLA